MTSECAEVRRGAVPARVEALRRLAGEQNRDEVYQSHLQIRGGLAGIEDVMTQAATAKDTKQMSWTLKRAGKE